MKGSIELKIALIKGKNLKEWELNWKKKKQQNICLNDEINWKKTNFNKSVKDKIRNLKIQGLKWKTKHMRNCNWRTKLKIIKTSINGKRNEIKN